MKSFTGIELVLSNKLFSLTKFGSLVRTLFKKQREFVEHKSLRKVALCTRRAGKSHAAAVYLLLEAARIKNCDVLYLGLTRTSCKNIMWPKFMELNAKYDLGLDMVESALIIKLPNGSRIHLFGADLENLADRLRGGKYALVIIDEAQSFGLHLVYLLHDVLEPATMDFQAPIALIGTPGNIAAGTFFEACSEDSSWAKFKWSVCDNIYVPHAADWLAKLKRERGWDDDNPTWRREYLAEWCHDPDSLVYRINGSTYKELPDISFDYIIGLDYGYNDQTAFAVIAYSNKWPCGYVVDCYGKDKMIPSKIAEELDKLIIKYRPERIVADTGGLGKSITEEMRIRYELPIYPADKTEKNTFIEMMNGDFANKKFLINESCTKLIEQMHNLTWDEKHKENASLRNDLCDSCLYGYRFSRHYWGKQEIKLTQTQLIEQEILEFAEQKSDKNWLEEL